MQPGEDACSIIASPRSWIEADAIIGLSNVYEAEEIDGRILRWTGPGAVFGIYLPVDRGYGWSVTLVCADGVDPFNWDNVFVEYEGDMVLCQHREVDGKHHLGCQVAAASNMAGAILRFYLQQARRMRAPLFGEADGRVLGLCLEAVALHRGPPAL